MQTVIVGENQDFLKCISFHTLKREFLKKRYINMPQPIAAQNWLCFYCFSIYCWWWSEKKGKGHLNWFRAKGTACTFSVSLMLRCLLQYIIVLFVNTPSTFSSLRTSDLLCNGLWAYLMECFRKSLCYHHQMGAFAASKGSKTWYALAWDRCNMWVNQPSGINTQKINSLSLSLPFGLWKLAMDTSWLFFILKDTQFLFK